MLKYRSWTNREAVLLNYLKLKSIGNVRQNTFVDPITVQKRRTKSKFETKEVFKSMQKYRLCRLRSYLKLKNVGKVTLRQNVKREKYRPG